MPIIFLGTVTDIAGEVVELGSEVTKFKTGDKVVAKLSDTVCFNSTVISLYFSAFMVSSIIVTYKYIFDRLVGD